MEPKLSITVLTFHAIEEGPSIIAFPPALFARAIEQLPSKRCENSEPDRSRGARLPTLGHGPMLSWSDFGGHTLTHPDLTRLSAELAGKEIALSKSVIENSLGVAVHCFAYPFGRYDARYIRTRNIPRSLRRFVQARLS